MGFPRGGAVAGGLDGAAIDDVDRTISAVLSLSTRYRYWRDPPIVVPDAAAWTQRIVDGDGIGIVTEARRHDFPHAEIAYVPLAPEAPGINVVLGWHDRFRTPAATQLAALIQDAARVHGMPLGPRQRQW